jgi:hypothetical protein
MIVHLLKCFFNECHDILESVCKERTIYTAVVERLVDALREHRTAVARAFLSR